MTKGRKTWVVRYLEHDDEGVITEERTRLKEPSAALPKGGRAVEIRHQGKLVAAAYRLSDGALSIWMAGAPGASYIVTDDGNAYGAMVVSRKVDEGGFHDVVEAIGKPSDAIRVHHRGETYEVAVARVQAAATRNRRGRVSLTESDRVR